MVPHHGTYDAQVVQYWSLKLQLVIFLVAHWRKPSLLFKMNAYVAKGPNLFKHRKLRRDLSFTQVIMQL